MQGSVWIIDGYNVIRRDGRLRAEEAARGTPSARRMLEVALGAFRRAAGRGAAIVLVYDGAPDRDRSGGGAAGLRILYPPRGQKADDVILAEARRADGSKRVHIVTSDIRDIGSRLRGLRVEHISAEEFSRRLEEAAAPGAEDGAAEKPGAQSNSEVDLWLRRFGGGGEGRDPGA
ncbi:MAG: NYN domain-containing protein [Planctomycetes bacterium]|nr:NYN domain-containing protein [Planctomycetota bacterium]